MIQQDLRSVHGYVLGIVGLVFALFIPFAVLILRIFKSNAIFGTFFLGIILSLIALVLGVMGLIKSLRQSTSLTKAAKILNILAIVISFILVVFLVYIFIKSRSLGGVI